MMMMNHTKIFMRKVVFNAKLNRENFINNKKKVTMSKANMMVKRQIHTNFMNIPPENDWLIIALCAIVGYSIVKINSK